MAVSCSPMPPAAAARWRRAPTGSIRTAGTAKNKAVPQRPGKPSASSRRSGIQKMPHTAPPNRQASLARNSRDIERPCAPFLTFVFDTPGAGWQSPGDRHSIDTDESRPLMAESAAIEEIRDEDGLLQPEF